jgi:hypothetical protein
MNSSRFKLTTQDLISWVQNAAFFLAPVAFIFIAFVQVNLEDGFQWSDFAPNSFVMGSITTYVLSESLALIKKWYSQHSYT